MGLKDQITDGLPSGFEGTISQVTFMHDTKYNNGATLMASFTIARDDGADDVEQRYTLGPGWSSVGGERISHDSGGNRINLRTAYGEFCSKVAEQVPDEVAASIDPTEGKSFIGLRFFWTRQTQHKEFTDKEGVLVKRDVTRLYPESYLGNGTFSTVDEGLAEETVTLSGAGITLPLPASLASKVVSLASSVPYENWKSSTLALNGAMDNADLVRAVATEGFYESLR